MRAPSASQAGWELTSHFAQVALQHFRTAWGSFSRSSQELLTLPGFSSPPWPCQDRAATCPGAPDVFLFSVTNCVMSPCVCVTVSG